MRALPPPLPLGALVLVAVLAVPALCSPLLPASSASSSGCPPAVSLRQCEAACDSDADCPALLVCCGTGCGGTACVRRVSPGQGQHGAHAQAKPGSCPAAELGAWVCSHRCSEDSDCAGSSKCCRNRCGALACTPPE